MAGINYQVIMAIDPGPIESGWVIMSGKLIIRFGINSNWELRTIIREAKPEVVAMSYEMIGSYGMPVGKEIFNTCVWIGRFLESFYGDDTNEDGNPIFRRDVKLHLCGSARAKDGNVRQAILDIYEPSGGGKIPQIGTKNQKGPLYGVSSHVWAALGVGLTSQGIWQKGGG